MCVSLFFCSFVHVSNPLKCLANGKRRKIIKIVESESITIAMKMTSNKIDIWNLKYYHNLFHFMPGNQKFLFYKNSWFTLSNFNLILSNCSISYQNRLKSWLMRQCLLYKILQRQVNLSSRWRSILALNIKSNVQNYITKNQRSSNWKLAIHMKWIYFVPISNGSSCQHALNSLWQHQAIKGYTISWFYQHCFRFWQMIQIWKIQSFHL